MMQTIVKKNMKNEVETMRDEILEANRNLTAQDIKCDLMRDMDFPARTLRHQAERRRKRLEVGSASVRRFI